LPHVRKIGDQFAGLKGSYRGVVLAATNRNGKAMGARGAQRRLNVPVRLAARDHSRQIVLAALGKQPRMGKVSAKAIVARQKDFAVHR
jgi:hypothetical protein